MPNTKNAGLQDKPTRRIMRALKINEISGVDVPAQEGAVAVILKRGDKPNFFDPKNPGKKKPKPGDKNPKTEDEDEVKAAGATSTAGTQEDTVMPTEKTQEHTDADAEVVDLNKQLDRANTIAKLTDAEKAVFNATADVTVQDEFLAKSADERKAALAEVAKKDADADPVAYTTSDGVVLRKSAGAQVISLAKSNDDLRKRVEKAEAVAETASYEKRVEADFTHLPGDLATRVSLLKAVDGIEDDEQRKASLAALKAQSDLLAKSFDTFGVSNAAVPGSAQDELDKLAATHQASNPGMSIEKAYDVVSQTEAGAELYAKTVN